MLASASQDCHIRIWKISQKESVVSSENAENLKVDEATFTTQKGIVDIVNLNIVFIFM